MRLALALLALGSAAQAETGGYNAHTNYILRCSGCHGLEGMGAEAAGVPPFPGSVGHIAASDLGRTYMMHVPGVVSASLSDAEIAAVMNYVIDRWSDAAFTPFTVAEVTERRAVPVEDVVAFRRGVVAELQADGIDIADYPWP